MPSLSKCKIRSLKSERATFTATIRNKKSKKIAHSFLSSINLPFRIEQSEFNLDLIRGKTDLPAPSCRRRGRQSVPTFVPALDGSGQSSFGSNGHARVYFRI